MKNFFTSKINWLAIVAILTAISPIIDGWDINKMTVQNWIVSILGLIVIIVRTWYTNVPIKTKKAMREKWSKPNLN